jgi:hypothetical protein
LGTLAGYSFLSRISKYLCERCGCFDKTLNYIEFEDEELEKGANSKQTELNKVDNIANNNLN